MLDKEHKKIIQKLPSFGQSACYQIKIMGRLDQSWTDRISGMRIEGVKEQDDKPVSILRGHLPDQAALAGILDTLYNMHFTILSVELVEDEDNK